MKKSFLQRNSVLKFIAMIGFAFYYLIPPTMAATRHVPSQYATINAAINASNNYDIMQISADVFSEFLTINRALELRGAGMSATIIHYHSWTQTIVNVNGTSLGLTDVVRFKDLTITGGQYLPPDIFFDVSGKGIEADDANIVLDDVSFNFITNYVVTIQDISLQANDVQLFPDFLNYTFQCDVGFNIKNSTATIDQLTQTRGNVDHTIDINSYATTPMTTFSDVKIIISIVRASELSWGECIRTYGRSDVHIQDCNLYRLAGGEAMQVLGHSAVGINGPYANLWVANTTLDGLPWAMIIHGSIVNSNRIVVVDYLIKNGENGGIQNRNANYNILDLGGGNYRSLDQNQFTNNNQRDVELFVSSGDVYALDNTWSNPDNPDLEIYDQLDDASLGWSYIMSHANPLFP